MLIGLISAIVHGVCLALDVFVRPLVVGAFPPLMAFLDKVHACIRFAFILGSTLGWINLPVLHHLEEREKRLRSGTFAVFLLGLESAIVLGCICLYFIVGPYFTAPGPHHLLWIWELGALFAFVMFAINLPRMAGTVNGEIQELHINGYHVHESVFGIIYFIAALLMIFNGPSNMVDMLYSSLFFLMGGFFFGRDIKDVMAGKFIVKAELEAREASVTVAVALLHEGVLADIDPTEAELVDSYPELMT
jgi:hypothetical protein